MADELSPGGEDAAARAEAPPKARRGRKPKQPQLAAGPGSGEAGRGKPAVRLDPATDGVTFDWPAIEQMAAQGGPNQAIAKLLIAARAEGANSRWPF